MIYRCLPRGNVSLAFVRRRFGAEKKVANYDEALGVAGMRQIRVILFQDDVRLTSGSRALSGLPCSHHRETTRTLLNSLGS